VYGIINSNFNSDVEKSCQNTLRRWFDSNGFSRSKVNSERMSSEISRQTKPQKRRRGFWRTLLQSALQYGASVLALYVLFRFLPARQVWKTLGLLEKRLWVFAIIGYLAAHVIGATKYRLVLNMGGAQMSARNAARCYFAGLFGSLFLPSLIGGDILRIAMALRVGKSKAAVLMGSVVDRISDFTALVLLVIVGAMLVPGGLDAKNRRIFIFAIALVALAGVVALAMASLFPVGRLQFKWRRKLAQMREAGQEILRQPRTMLKALSMSVVVQLAFILLNVVLAVACGLRLPYRVWVFAWPLAKLSAAVPITQAGIGVREVALAGLLRPFGAPVALSVATGLAWDVVVVGGAIAGGIFALIVRSGPREAAASR
jgi:glycosyltransferase 2 family protein